MRDARRDRAEARSTRPDGPASTEPRDPRAGRLRRLRGHLQGAQHAAHAADVGHERDPRHRRARRPGRASARPTASSTKVLLVIAIVVRHDQRRRRLPGHRPDARDVQGQADAEPTPRSRTASDRACRTDVITSLYIVAFSLFIYGLMGLTGPTTAVRGNRIAAVGMAIAVDRDAARSSGIGNWGLIIARHRDRHGHRRPGGAQREDDGDAADGGAVQRRRRRRGRADRVGGVPRDQRLGDRADLRRDLRRASRRSSARSRSGARTSPSASCRSSCPGRPITIGRAQRLHQPRAAAASPSRAASRSSPARTPSCCSSSLLVAAASLGNFVVLPIGGADMPVVISTAQRVHRPERGRDRRRARQHRADRRRHDRRRLAARSSPT